MFFLNFVIILDEVILLEVKDHLELALKRSNQGLRITTKK